MTDDTKALVSTLRDEAALSDYDRTRRLYHAAGDLIERQAEQLATIRRARSYELEHARAQVDNAVRLLTGIHSLLYPAPIKTPDGRTLVFRPDSLDPHKVLQELSDRIRALPDELAAMQEAPANGSMAPCFYP